MRRLLIVAITSVALGILVLVVLVSLDPSPLDPIINPDRIEVVNVKWGKMVNRTYEPEDARWINFTIYNHGENKTSVWDAVKFELFGLCEGNVFRSLDKRGWNLIHGENEIMMMGTTTINKYQLKSEGQIIWEGSL